MILTAASLQTGLDICSSPCASQQPSQPHQSSKGLKPLEDHSLIETLLHCTDVRVCRTGIHLTLGSILIPAYVVDGIQINHTRYLDVVTQPIPT